MYQGKQQNIQLIKELSLDDVEQQQELLVNNMATCISLLNNFDVGKYSCTC
jgi:hypothetical protein